MPSSYYSFDYQSFAAVLNNASRKQYTLTPVKEKGCSETVIPIYSIQEAGDLLSECSHLCLRVTGCQHSFAVAI